ncbi:MAG: DUF4116 domain-containing protein [Proteobacteria bacterium]|nr:DUF4116 domain-containing protein [Pseudomonadota bacterium]
MQKITRIFYCGFFSLLFCCASNSVPPPEQDPLYQALNSDSFAGSSIGRPPAPDVLTSKDNAPANPNILKNSGNFPPFPNQPIENQAAIQAQAAPNFSTNPAQEESIKSNQQNLYPNFPANQNPNSQNQILQRPNPDSNLMQQSPPQQIQQAGIPPRFFPAIPQPNQLASQQFFPPQNQMPDQQIQDSEVNFDFSQASCNIDKNGIAEIIFEVQKKKNAVFKTLPSCLKINRKLIMSGAIIDPSEFQYAADNLREDESFVQQLIEINPEILEFADSSLRSDAYFMQAATYINRQALQYADPKLLNNKIFMRDMIRIDAKNYIFASDRLKEIPEFAKNAFQSNGLLLEFAPQKIKENKSLVKVAVQSNAEALQFASEKLKADKDLKKLALKKFSIKSIDDLKKFLRKNYINESDKKNIGVIIDNRMKFFAKNKIIDRNYITKWQRSFEFKNDETRLISADSRNYPVLWKEDFKKFPLLIKKIESFLLNRQVDQNTIDNLATTYFWKVKRNPQTVVFNLYLLRDSKEADLGSKFNDITSLTAIAQKHGETWDLSVVEVIFDKETLVSLSYENGHKKYILWDLYVIDKKDKNPKILFKVEDKFSEYFEIFEEQNNQKYRSSYRVDSLKDSSEEDTTIKEIDKDSF